MKLNNATNIPKPIADTLESLYNSHPAPSEGVYYVTELLKSPKEILINRAHYGEVVRDIQEAVSAIFGTAFHEGVASKLAKKDGCTVEKRYTSILNVPTDLGNVPIVISGALDLVWQDENGDAHIIDWKTCSLMKVDMERSGEEESWKKQGYIYAWLLEQNTGIRAVDITMCAFPKDVKGKPNFSDRSTWKLQPVTFDATDREYEKALLDEYIGKLREILHNTFFDEEPRKCTQEEMWQAPATYAVKKPDAKQAAKVLSSVAEAQKFIADKNWIGKGYMIYERPSEPKKCCDWCDARNWCKQGKDAIAAFEATKAREFNDKGETV